MINLRRAYRNHRSLFIFALVLIFIIADAAMALLITSESTAEMPADRTHYTEAIVQVERSSISYYIMTESSVVRRSWDSFTFNYGSNPTSIRVGVDSDGMGMALANGSVVFIWSGEERPSWWREMNGSAQVVGLSEKGSQFGFNPDKLFVLTQNSTGHALVGLSSTNRGREALHWDFDENVTKVASSSSSHFLAFLLGNSTIAVFSKDMDRPLGYLPATGEVLEIKFSDDGARMVLLESLPGGRRVQVYALPSMTVVSSLPVDGTAHNLRLRGDQTPVYVQDGDSIKVWDIEGEQRLNDYLEVHGLQDYTFASVSDEIFVSSTGQVSMYLPGRRTAVWTCPLDGEAAHLRADSGGWQVLAFDDHHLAVIDNTRNLAGSKVMWTLFGSVLIAEVALLLILFYWKRIRDLSRRSLAALAVGVLAGIVVAGIFIDAGFVEWMGETAYLLVSGAVAALVCLVVREADAGLGGMVMGVFLGVPLAICISLTAAFLLWASGYQFAEQQEIFVTAVLSLVTGLKMGLVGGLAGALLGRYLL